MPNRDESLPEEVITAWVRLVRVCQSLLSAVDTSLKSEGFPPLSWYDALLELSRAGPAGLRPFELQEAMLLAQYNLSRLIERLLKVGYVARQPCEEDGRGHILTITPKGERLLKEMWPVYRAAIRSHFVDKIGSRNARQLGEILGMLTQAR